MKYMSFSVLALLALSSCGGGDVSRSGTKNLNENNADYVLYDRNSNPVGFVSSDVKDNKGFLAYSNFDDSYIGEAPTSGKASMDVDYRVVGYFGINKVGGNGYTDNYRAYPINRPGNLTVDFDFDSGTFSGSNAYLDMSGTINGNDLSGSVSYNGVGGTLDGAVDANQTVGAFNGNSSSVTYAGAFYGTKIWK